MPRAKGTLGGVGWSIRPNPDLKEFTLWLARQADSLGPQSHGGGKERGLSGARRGLGSLNNSELRDVGKTEMGEQRLNQAFACAAATRGLSRAPAQPGNADPEGGEPLEGG